MNTRKLLSLEWDAIAGILAAVAAIVLHLLHVGENLVLPITLALIALLFINFIRHTRNNELTAEQVDRTEHAVNRIQSALKHPEVILVGPLQLRSVNEHFIKHMNGDSIWFNVCLSMYRTRPLFDAMLVHGTQLQRPHQDHFGVLQRRLDPVDGVFRAIHLFSRELVVSRVPDEIDEQQGDQGKGDGQDQVFPHMQKM